MKECSGTNTQCISNVGGQECTGTSPRSKSVKEKRPTAAYDAYRNVVAEIAVRKDGHQHAGCTRGNDELMEGVTTAKHNSVSRGGGTQQFESDGKAKRPRASCGVIALQGMTKIIRDMFRSGEGHESVKDAHVHRDGPCAVRAAIAGSASRRSVQSSHSSAKRACTSRCALRRSRVERADCLPPHACFPSWRATWIDDMQKQKSTASDDSARFHRSVSAHFEAVQRPPHEVLEPISVPEGVDPFMFFNSGAQSGFQENPASKDEVDMSAVARSDDDEMQRNASDHSAAVQRPPQGVLDSSSAPGRVNSITLSRGTQNCLQSDAADRKRRSASDQLTAVQRPPRGVLDSSSAPGRVNSITLSRGTQSCLQSDAADRKWRSASDQLTAVQRPPCGVIESNFHVQRSASVDSGDANDSAPMIPNHRGTTAAAEGFMSFQSSSARSANSAPDGTDTMSGPCRGTHRTSTLCTSPLHCTGSNRPIIKRPRARIRKDGGEPPEIKLLKSRRTGAP